MTSLFFSVSLFISALLLFIIQPMVAKSLLPVYGGTPGVWTVCMLFFQALLLVAYGYAWLVSRFNNRWVWRLVHTAIVLLSLTVLPLNFEPSLGGRAQDIAILRDLLYQLGLPLLVVASSAPLLQFLYSRSRAKKANDPYFLYVASNVGSLLALVSYPWFIERWSGLTLQFSTWNYVFITYLFFIAGLLFLVPLNNQSKRESTSQRVHRGVILKWIAYSFIPCSLMLSVTFYITTDIAATPLFWIIPLVLYLLTFIITFTSQPLISHLWVGRCSRFIILLPVIGILVGPNLLSAWQLMGCHLLSFFILALFYHGELVKIRPPVNQLTSFYVCLALGGVFAGLFNGLMAPRYFNGAYEYPIVLILSMVCLPLRWVYKTNVLAGMSILFIFLLSPWYKSSLVLAQMRNFYGVKQVLHREGAHVLMSQNTMHGFQLLDSMNSTNGALGYYGPMASVMSYLQEAHPELHASIIGLGTGLMACQFRKNDTLEMIDIDEQVVSLAKNSRYFTYLRACPPNVSVILGDGRGVLKTRSNASLELVVLDAFSSDAIPTHLVTKEAFALYLQKLTADGVLLLHASNRHVGLLPIIAAAGQELDVIVLHKQDSGNTKIGQLPSEWILLSANAPLAMTLMRKEGWRFASLQKIAPWTDDYSNLISLLKW